MRRDHFEYRGANASAAIYNRPGLVSLITLNTFDVVPGLLKTINNMGMSKDVCIKSKRKFLIPSTMLKIMILKPV